MAQLKLKIHLEFNANFATKNCPFCSLKMRI
jgi:hypothetical protein